MLSALDIGLLLFIGTHMAMGVGAGFLRGLLGLLGAAAAIAIALVAGPVAAGYAPSWLPWPDTIAGWIVLIVSWLIVPRLAMWMAPEVRPDRGFWERALGVVPGLGWGLMGAGCFLWLYGAFAGGIPPGSPVAAFVDWSTRPALQAMSAQLPGAGQKPLPAPDALAHQLLDLVNAERVKAKLKPLVWDAGLAAVGRAHSADMLKHNYFAHVSPDKRAIGERLIAAKVGFKSAGENLAFAPTLSIAHQGLMDSPGHRANILRPAFGRLGVGLVRLPPGSPYAPVVDGKPTAHLPMGAGGYLVITQVFAN